MSFSDITAEYIDTLTQNQKEKLDMLGNCLVEKNKVMNLTALTDEKSIALLHFWDSLTLLKTKLFDGKKSVIDIGCGGGFPSLPLAIACRDLSVTSNDSTSKKLSFVRETAEKCGLSNIKILQGRAEELSRDRNYRQQFDIAVSRGVARLNILCEWCMPFVKKGGYFVAMKGEKGQEEADEAKNAIQKLGGELVDIMNFKVPEFDYLHTLVIIRKKSDTSDIYPRRNSAISKKPL